MPRIGNFWNHGCCAELDILIVPDLYKEIMMNMECRFCQKTFSKGEHLRRHERSHTGYRPYRCKECQRPFARQDSLARHAKLHTRVEPTQYPSPTSSHNSKKPRLSDDLSPSMLEYMGETPKSTAQFSDGLSDHISIPSDGSISMNASTSEITQSADLDFSLIWPDSEDLFDTLMASEATNHWQMPLPALPISSPSLYNYNQYSSPTWNNKELPARDIPVGESHRAVQNVSQMVSSLSSSVTSAIESTSLTSVFLDECLHMFFNRFIPTFPILHRATFVFKECTQPLLLNAMAIGSLYLGPKDSATKGEALWRLAHVAVTTSWESLITHRGPYDGCQGVQLVVTALLGQVYGALSKNRVIRNTSQAFHSLGFFWARQCGLLDSDLPLVEEIPSEDASIEEKNRSWKSWASREIQKRALLGLYLVDGLVSRMYGQNPSVRHTANQLSLPSSEAAFEAYSVDAWLAQIKSEETNPNSFRKIINSLFLPAGQPSLLDRTISPFSLRVILEAIQSLIPSTDEAEETILIGTPTKPDLRLALSRIYNHISSLPTPSTPEILEILLRWHTISLDLCKDSSLLCRSICSRYNITQHVFGGGKGGKTELDLVSWANTEDGRRAILHAVAIQEIIEALPRGRAHVIHIPSSLFASATVYCVFSLAGQTSVTLPEKVDWRSVLSSGYESCGIEIDEGVETRKYIRGSGVGKGGAKKSLLYELNSMQKLFRCLCSQWGVAFDMEDVIDQWMSLCH